MASVAAAGYTAHFKDSVSDFHFLEGFMNDFLAQDSIIVTKETKKGTSQMDIRPGIYECKVTPEGILAFTVDASSGGNIKPALLLGALWKLPAHRNSRFLYLWKKWVRTFERCKAYLPETGKAYFIPPFI